MGPLPKPLVELVHIHIKEISMNVQYISDDNTSMKNSVVTMLQHACIHDCNAFVLILCAVAEWWCSAKSRYNHIIIVVLVTFNFDIHSATVNLASGNYF